MDMLGMSKTNTLKLVVLVMILSAVAYVVWRGRSPHPLAVGDSAPDFTVAAVPSGTLESKKYDQEVIVLNFWATWCQPCVEEAPSLEKFAERVRPQGVVVLGVSVDEDRQALAGFVDQYRITYPIGVDPERALAARFGTFQFPETYILDRHGRVAEKVVGAINWDDPRILNFVQNLARASGR
jgi:peroxiredoxin